MYTYICGNLGASVDCYDSAIAVEPVVIDAILALESRMTLKLLTRDVAARSTR